MSNEPVELLPTTAPPALLKVALDSLPMAAVLSEAGPESSRILAVNHAFVDLLGWPADELIGVDAATRLYAGPIGVGDLHSVLSSADQVLEYECQSRRKDGSLQTMRNRTRVFTWEGQAYAISTSLAAGSPEIDDRLHESEARLQAILDAIPFLFAVIETDGRFRMANRALYQQVGREPEDVLGHHVTDVFTRRASRGVLEYLARMGTADLEVEELPFGTDDRLLRFRTSRFPLRHRTGNRVGEPYAACVLAIDVTDERATEEALRESDTRFRQLASSIDDAFILWSSSDPPELLYASPTLAGLYGVDHVADIPRDANVHDVTAHPDDESMRMSMFEQRLGSDDDLDYEYRIIRADGEVRWLRIRSSRVRVDGKAVDRVATVMSDITDRKLAELELQAARSAAEDANQRKNDFLSRMSHELRTPLNAILGFTQLLELDDLTNDQRSSLAHVGRAGRHLLELINDVLDVSRIESGELRLSLAPVDLGEVLLEAVAMMRPQLDESDVTLDLPLDAPSVTVMADRQRLIQIVLNLLTNAVKFNRTGGLARVRWTALPTGRVRVAVSDTGIGMTRADLDRLFTPFERFAPEVEGTGIGLTLTRQLVEAMGGTIDVESTLGEGTTFTVDLPGTRAALRSASTGANAGDGPTTRGRVLCVEGNAADTELLRRTVDLVPHCDLEVVATARDALRRATDEVPDLLLLDLPLPDQTAEALLEQLRACDETAAVDVLVIAADLPADRRRALAALGVSRFLIKPYRLSQVLDVVEAAIDR